MTNTFLRDDGTFAQAGAGLQGYLSGGILSNDVTTPNSVLDVSSCVATDNTSTTGIVLGAFTKSTAGAWAPGSGNNGMGNGLTVATSTWYNVMLANNGGSPDIWFDTSATGANRPSGISDTKYRRLGSIKTDGSANIRRFVQYGNFFYTALGTAANGSTSVSQTNLTLDLPTGVTLSPLLQGIVAPGAGSSIELDAYSITQPTLFMRLGVDITPASISSEVCFAGTLVYPTNTSAQIQYAVSLTGTGTWVIELIGYYDMRGQ